MGIIFSLSPSYSLTLSVHTHTFGIEGRFRSTETATKPAFISHFVTDTVLSEIKSPGWVKPTIIFSPLLSLANTPLPCRSLYRHWAIKMQGRSLAGVWKKRKKMKKLPGNNTNNNNDKTAYRGRRSVSSIQPAASRWAGQQNQHSIKRAFHILVAVNCAVDVFANMQL